MSIKFEIELDNDSERKSGIVARWRDMVGRGLTIPEAIESLCGQMNARAFCYGQYGYAMPPGMTTEEREALAAFYFLGAPWPAELFPFQSRRGFVFDDSDRGFTGPPKVSDEG